MRHQTCYLLAFVILAGLLPGCQQRSSDSDESGSSQVTVQATKFDGVESAITAARGKVVLVDCWATWCGPCVKSFPALVQKHKKYADKGLAVISLSLDEQGDADAVLRFLRKQNATFTNLQMVLDSAAEKGLQERFAYRGSIPHAVLFNRSGERVWAGHPLDSTLEQRLQTELAN